MIDLKDLIILYFDNVIRKVTDRSKISNLWAEHDRVGAVENRLLTSLFDESRTATNDRSDRLELALFDQVSCSRVQLPPVCKFKGKVGPVDHDRVAVGV